MIEWEWKVALYISVESLPLSLRLPTELQKVFDPGRDWLEPVGDLRLAERECEPVWLAPVFSFDRTALRTDFAALPRIEGIRQQRGIQV